MSSGPTPTAQIDIRMSTNRKFYISDVNGVEKNFLQHINDHSEDLKTY